MQTLHPDVDTQSVSAHLLIPQNTKTLKNNYRSGVLPASYPVLIACFIILLLTACKKDIKSVSEISVTDREVKSGPIPAYNFDWETATTMPSAPSSTYNPIPMPWNSGTTAIDPNLVSDYHKSDGWNLVWNTFSPTTLLGDPSYTYFFSLYNVYRGQLRIYLWHLANSNATTYVNHGLSLYGSPSSPILNFNATDMVDLSTNKQAFTQVLKQQMTSAQGTWFVFQYEMAYDPNLASTTFPNFGLAFQPQWVNITNVSLNGTQNGTIEGYVGDPNSSSFNFGSVLLDGATSFLGNLNYTQLFAKLDSGRSDKPYESAVNNAAGSILKGFLNGIFGGGGSSQPVNLTINTKIKLDGSFVSNGLIADKKLVLPGQSNSQTADGNTPLYNSTMGIMTLSATPVVNINIVRRDEQFPDPWDNYFYQIQYDGSHTLDNNSFSILWNQAIINNNTTGATIQNLKVQIVKTIKAYDHGIRISGFWPVPQGWVVQLYSENIVYEGSYDQIESVGNELEVVSGHPNSNIPLVITSQDMSFGLNTGVRISFDVVPNNGAPRSTIVKTFKAREVNIY